MYDQEYKSYVGVVDRIMFECKDNEAGKSGSRFECSSFWLLVLMERNTRKK